MVVLGFWARLAVGPVCEELGFVYWSVKFLAGGQAKVLLGMVFGIGSLIKGSDSIS